MLATLTRLRARWDYPGTFTLVWCLCKGWQRCCPPLQWPCFQGLIPGDETTLLPKRHISFERQWVMQFTVSPFGLGCCTRARRLWFTCASVVFRPGVMGQRFLQLTTWFFYHSFTFKKKILLANYKLPQMWSGINYKTMFIIIKLHENRLFL